MFEFVDDRVLVWLLSPQEPSSNLGQAYASSPFLDLRPNMIAEFPDIEEFATNKPMPHFHSIRY